MLYFGITTILLGIILIIIKLKTIMANLQDLQTALATITTTVNQLGTDVSALAAKINTPGGLSQADLDDTVTKLQAIGTQLQSLDATVVADTIPPTV